MPELIIRSGKLSGRKLVLPATEIVIGRDDDCQIRLTSADVSRRHCQILVTKEGLVAKDLGSRNGTFINEESVVDSVTLQPGDKLRVGPMIFEVPSAKEPDIAPVESPQEKSPVKKKKKKKKQFIALPSREKRGTSNSSDNDIASWLSAGDEDEEVSTGDTTIIPRSSPVLEELAKRKKELEQPKKTVSQKPSSPSAESKPSEHSIASSSKRETLEEEAAEIIRKHWESVQHEEGS